MKFRIFIFYFMIYVGACLVQFLFGKYVDTDMLFPNFILITIIFFALFRRGVCSITVSFLLGLTWDIFSTDIVGIRSIIFTVLTYAVSIVVNDFYKEKILVQFLIVFISGIVYGFAFSLMFYVLSLNEKGYFSINYALVVQAVITAAAAPICLSILNKIRLFLFPNNILNEGQR